MCQQIATLSNWQQDLRAPSSRMWSVTRVAGLAAVVLVSCVLPSRAMVVEEAAITKPEISAHAGVEPMIARAGRVASESASVQVSAPVMLPHNPVHPRGPLWHTAYLEGGQTSIRPAMPFEICHCYAADGGNGAFSFYLTDHLAVTAEGSRISSGSPEQPIIVTSYLFGPHASVLVGRHLIPFGHILLGKIDVEGQTSQGGTFSSSSVAIGWGAGIDVVLNRDTSLRLAQVDSFVNLLPHSVNIRQSDLRLTFGVVFRFGN